MPRIEAIKALETPDPAKQISKASQEILNAITRLKKEEVLRLQPDPDKSMRGLKASISRVGPRNNLKVEAWTDPEEEFFYVRKVR